MTSERLEAANTLKNPTAVAPAKGTGATVRDGSLTATLPPYSYQMLRLSVAAP
jgi:alpha-N-arabinofuranosidase